MAHLIYSAISSLDGYIEDREGSYDWAMPDEEVHGFINDLERSAGTYLFGRRMYETMVVWETDPSLASMSPYTRDYAAIWQAADKIVYSRSLDVVSTRRTRLERNVDPEEIRQLKASAKNDLGIGGPGLAAHAFRAGLIDKCRLFLAPVIVGGGKPSLPARGRPSALLAGEGTARLSLRRHERRCRTGGLLRLLRLLGFAIAALLTFGHSGSP